MSDKEKYPRANEGFRAQIQDYRKDEKKKEEIQRIRDFLKDKKEISLDKVARMLNFPREFIQIRVEEMIIYGLLPGVLKGDLYMVK